MTKRASARVIGVFVLGAVTLLVAGVMIFGGFKLANLGIKLVKD